MAKKSTEPMYVEAALAIKKEDFKALLVEQIGKGEQLLGVVVPVLNHIPRGYGGFLGGSRVDEKVIYDEEVEKEFIAAYKRWHSFNVEVYKSSFVAPNSTYRHEYENQMWTIWGNDTIKEYKENIRRLINQMKCDIEKLPLIKCVAESCELLQQLADIQSNKVFIVHGHDGELKEKVARTLDQLGLEPIILHEQVDGGRTIIEKFEANAEDCRFAVILLTADDYGQSKEERNEEEEPKLRARQNVVFEMGYFMGRLGRSRVVALLDNGVEKPGDIDGFVYVSTVDEYGWKLRLVKELNNCGYNVDANKII